MKKPVNSTFVAKIILLLLIFGITASCLKDRTFEPVTPVIPGTGPGSTYEIIHYWDFNGSNLLSPTNSLSTASITTADTYDETDGTLLNIQYASDSGSCLRVRNPSTYLVINAPTTNHDSIVVSFAAMRTNNGAQANSIEYSIDGTTFTNSGLTPNQIAITTDWQLFYINFTGIAGVANNPDFKVKIIFTNGNTNSSGNDRYDNLIVGGSQM